MAELTTTITAIERPRRRLCWLCGGDFDQQSVAVTLIHELSILGVICPRCLAGPPARAAEAARRRANQLRGAVSEGTQGQEAADALPHPDELVGVAGLLERLSQWPTSLDEVIEAERACLRLRFPHIGEDDLRRLVDGRYEEMLREPE